MASAWLRNLLRASSLLRSSSASASSFRSILLSGIPILSTSKHLLPGNPASTSWSFRNLSYGSVNFVLAEGKPKFETHEVDPPKKEKWKNKKRFKLQKKREKQRRKAANKKDPRHVGKKRKQKFANAEERIKYKLERARMKEALLIEKLKQYEVPKVQGPMVEPDNLTGEERFFLKKMGQKKSNYVPLGRRGVFGGVILNMHMHWKKHETVKVICKPCKPGQIHEYAREIARLSGGIPIQVIGDDTIIFYRGRNYVQPEIMSPIDTLSKKRALEKSKYEQSLESVRRFIAIAEKELELYYRHTALYGDPNSRNPIEILDGPINGTIGSEEVDCLKKERQCMTDNNLSRDYLPLDSDFSDLSETDSEDGSGDDMSISESDAEYGRTQDISDDREEFFLEKGGHSTHDLALYSSASSLEFGAHEKSPEMQCTRHYDTSGCLI